MTSRLRMLIKIPNQLISRAAHASLSLPRKISVEHHHHSAINNFRHFSVNAPDDKPEVQNEPAKKPIGKLQARLMIAFTCKKCNTRSSKTMSKLAYETGVVIIRCDGCKNNHLIADNLGWFNDRSKQNIEKIMQLKGETVRRLNVYGSDAIEVVENEVREMESGSKK